MACRRASSCPPSSRCSIPTSSAAWWPKATRSASTAGSTSATRCCRWTPSATCRCARPTRWRRSPACARSASARRRGTSARTRSPSRATWGSNTTPRMMADDDCYELLLDGEPTGVVELPVEWIRDDAVYYNMNRFAGLRPNMPPSDVFDIFRREFDMAWEEGGVFQLTMHPHHLRLPLARLGSGRADPPRQGARQRLVRHPCRHRPLRARQRAIAGALPWTTSPAPRSSARR